jgi:fructoselysine-6-phosphate deglycase
MLNFDEGRFLRIQSGAVGLAPRIHEVMSRLVIANDRNLFFLGTGGAAILMHPAAQLLQRHSSMPVFAEISAELVVGGHRMLGRNSIVVIPSLSGTTRESIEALDFCRSRGATVIALTGSADSPLAKGAHHALVNFAEDDTSSESFYLQSLLIALSAMAIRGEIGDHGPAVSELQRLPKLLLGVKRGFESRAESYAEAIRTEPYHIISAAGSCWPEAWYYGMCILEEMQWIRTRPVHAADFFHGTLELMEKGVSAMLFKGEDAYRGIAERAERFMAQHTDKLFVLDTATFNMGNLSASTRALISPVILAAALERLSAHLEVKRNHPLTTRRYYKRIAY